MRTFRLVAIGLVALFVVLACGGDKNSGDNEDDQESYSFSIGVNLTEWFQVNGFVHSANFGKYTKEDFAELKKLGVNVIRLPIVFNTLEADASYKVDKLFFDLLDQVVDWAEYYKIYIIIDNHSSRGHNPTPVDIDKTLIPLWTELADHFKNRSEFVLYEILNEDVMAEAKSASRWSEIQQEVIKAIRSKDQTHSIIVGGYDWNNIDSLIELPEFDDSNLIYVFHFYNPHIFTYQGTTWEELPLTNLEGLPFPYDAHEMPKTPDEFIGTWREDQINRYHLEATQEALAEALDKAAKFSKDRNAKIFCGEFGVNMPNALREDRLRWYETVVKLLNDRNISWTQWDYSGDFGIYKTPQGGDIYSDLDIDIVKALGFTPPTQKTSEKIKDSFTIYGDYFGKMILPTHSVMKGSQHDLFDTDSYEGKYAIFWGAPAQYDSYTFKFIRAVDWEYLKDNNYALQFKAKATSKNAQKQIDFDVRFVDRQSDSEIPWRMRYKIDQNILPVDGEWHTITIPLKDMSEHGAWDSSANKWHDPSGLFSWEAIDLLQFVAENADLSDFSIWIDSIEIVKKEGI
ncbi:MAG: glycoside hydrolase family 5 protein [Helicobacteraceae bacterium]|jgi:endoglucanase|nr:glycoside hydrolase family 5 protein [Helicobacteraceae bacterium]